MPITNGDLIYDTGEFLIHDECFYDYVRMTMLDNGWQRKVYGDLEEML